MFTKIVVILILLIIIVSLGGGLVYLLKDRNRSHRAARALTFRIGLSLALLFFLVLAYNVGWLHPHGLAGLPPR
jgi:hypothetical protein